MCFTTRWGSRKSTGGDITMMQVPGLRQSRHNLYIYIVDLKSKLSRLSLKHHSGLRDLL